MINLAILALYAISILIYLIVSFFIIYHLTTYSINSEFKVVMTVFFVVVTAGLLISNLSLFFSINWSSIIYELMP